VTTPFENDVYLCSHAAIQGTARPTHYTVLMDEMNVDVDKFQALLYDHCYQYQRATTPVSLCKYTITLKHCYQLITYIVPAVYYAHLASKRAEAHINMAETQKAQVEAERRKNKGLEGQTYTKETLSWSEWPKLMGFQPQNQIHLGMWYI